MPTRIRPFIPVMALAVGLLVAQEEALPKSNDATVVEIAPEKEAAGITKEVSQPAPLKGPKADQLSVEDLLGRSELLKPEDRPVMPKEGGLLMPEDLDGPASLEGAAETKTVLLPQLPDAVSGPGEISGAVFDSDGRGIPGAIVVFPKVGSFQLRTDAAGRFSAKGLPAGAIEIEILKPAFQTKKQTITILEEGVTEISSSMEIKPVELADGEYLLEDREIVADFQEESFGGIDLGGNDGSSLMSAIGRDVFEKQNLSNAADAVGRISGANIVGGKYAVIRGLSDRYKFSPAIKGGAKAKARVSQPFTFRAPR